MVKVEKEEQSKLIVQPLIATQQFKIHYLKTIVKQVSIIKPKILKIKPFFNDFKIYNYWFFFQII